MVLFGFVWYCFGHLFVLVHFLYCILSPDKYYRPLKCLEFPSPILWGNSGPFFLPVFLWDFPPSSNEDQITSNSSSAFPSFPLPLTLSCRLRPCNHRGFPQREEEGLEKGWSNKVVRVHFYPPFFVSGFAGNRLFLEGKGGIM